MSKPIKQHYVPQFLLKNFSNGKSNYPQVWVLDKQTGETFPSSVRKIAHENLFYEYHGEGGDFELEDLMQKIDSKGAMIISNILQKDRLPHPSENFVWLSFFVAVQLLRTPATRNDMENFRQLLIQWLGGEFKVHPDDPRTLGEYGPEDAKASSLLTLASDVPQIAKLLRDKVWFLCKTSRKAPFIISDNPVTRHNMVDRGPRGNLGLRNEGIEIYMPLSPTLSIQAVCPKIAYAALRTSDLAVDFREAIANIRPLSQEPPNTEFINSLQVIRAERFVYAKERKHLEMPIDMLRTNPELMDGPGVRNTPEITRR